MAEQNRTEQNRTEQNRTEQNRTEQNRTEQNRTEQNKDSGYSNSCQDIPICLGGFGELCNKTQYHNQNRVYSSFTVAVVVTTAFQPWYLVKNEKDMECSN